MVRAEARHFYATQWDPDRTVADWYDTLVRSGWGYPAWPTAWFGQGLSPRAARAARDERRAAGALGPPSGIGPTLLAPMLFAHGTPEQTGRFVEAMTVGNQTFAQMLSEPDAGSDLAGVRTRAEQDGDEWVITGSKIWTSNAGSVDYGMLLARTNWDVPKHAGLTFFLIRRDQPGVEVRPLRQMTGDAKFNQVYFDTARVPAADVLGDVDGGWAVTRTFLAHEKNSYNPDAHEGGPFGRVIVDMAAGAFTEHLKRQATTSAQGRGIGSVLTELVIGFDRAADPLVRQALARLHTTRQTMTFTNQRVKAARKGAKASPATPAPGVEAAGSKLTVSALTRAQRDLGLAVQGPYGMLTGDDADTGREGAGTFQYFALSTPALSIAGGTDEIQRNHLGERVLGLPSEPSPERTVPFKDLPASGAAASGAPTKAAAEARSGGAK